MRWPISLALAAALSVPVAHAWEPSLASVDSRLRETLGSLKTWIDQDPSGRTAQIRLNRAMLPTAVVQPYFYAVGGALHEPSEARDQRVREIEERLEPYQTVLLDLMRLSRSDNEAPNAAAQVVAFLPPSARLRASLLEIARDPASDAAKAADAYEALFMLGLDDAALRTEVARLAEGRTRLSPESDLPVALARRAAQRWALAEIEPLLSEIIRKPCIPAHIPQRGARLVLVGDYVLAAEGFSRFGVLAERYLPEIRARQRELNLDEADEALAIQRLTACAERLEGTRAPELALTWKGKYVGISGEAFAAWMQRQSTRSDAR